MRYFLCIIWILKLWYNKILFYYFHKINHENKNLKVNKNELILFEYIQNVNKEIFIVYSENRLAENDIGGKCINQLNVERHPISK